MASFQFKQFAVAHDKCAMKVNTDGVLLGAWAAINGATHILDIGTGTGVIALMLAQQNPEAAIDAIDIDEQAAEQAKQNFAQSPWRDRLAAIHTPLQQFLPQRKYDAIVTNPPYFINDFKAPGHQKNIARHSVMLTYEQLLSGISRLLAAGGNAFMVIPYFNLDAVASIAVNEKLFVTRATEVIAVEGKPPYLWLLQLSAVAEKMDTGTITIQSPDGNFTGAYKALTGQFYLKF